MSRRSHLVGGGQRFREDDSRVPIPIGALVRNSSLASGGSHCVVEILNNILDEIFSELKVTEVVERGEKLEMLHEPGLSRKHFLL